MNYTKQIINCCILVFFALYFFSCRRAKVELTIIDIMGEWQRIDSDKPDYDGLRIKVDTADKRAQGYISFQINPNPYFSLGDQKWKDIKPSIDSTYEYLDLGSNGNYYAGTMQLKNEWDGLYLNIKIKSPFDTYGTTQRWYKQR